MDVLQRWLNDEVGLSKHITNFEKDFANGYFFGEIFNKFNLQPDFRSFLNFHSMDSKMNNFARLEPVLRVLDVKVPSKTLNEIMEEKKGVAARVLLSVKAALENISEEDRRRANTPTSLPPLSRGSMFQQQQENQLSSSLQSSLQSSHQFTASPPQRSSESAGQQSPKRHSLRTFDSEPPSTASQPSEKDQPPSLQDVKPINVKIDKHQVDLKYQQYVEEKARRKKMKQTAEATHDVVSGIESFEKSLKNFTYEDSQQNQTQNSQQMGVTNRKPPTTTTRRVVPSSTLTSADGDDDEDSKKYLQKIKKKKDEEQIARQERDKRRRKILVEQQQVQKALDDKQNEEMLLERLLRQSKEERRIAARIVETRNKTKEIRKNRVLREEQYASLRQKEFELLLEKDAQLGRAAKLEYELKAKLDRELFEQYEARRRVIKQDKHYSICGRIVDYFVDIAFKIVEYKRLSDGQVPVKELREWKTLFKSGVPLFPPKKQASASTVPLTFSSYEAEDEHDSILNERDFLDYLKGKEEWALSVEGPLPSLSLPSSSHPVSSSTILLSTRGTSSQQPHRPVSPSISPSRPVTPQPSQQISSSSPFAQFNPLSLVNVPQNNEILGKIISYLFSLSLPKDPPPPPPVMPNFNFKICLVGKHLAGKSTILKKLAESYRITVISAQQLVLKAIEESRDSQVPTEFTEIGVQCAQALEENKEVGDEIVVKLIVREINEIARINEEENKSNTGWVLDGFPETVAQAQLLEKALTGYEPPPSPKAKKVRSKKKLAEKASKKRASQIAQPPVEDTTPTVSDGPLKSGIDLVVHVNVSDDTIIRRSVGRRIDPTTGVTYHLEYNSPPEHKGVHGRLVPVEIGDTTVLYQNMSAFKDEVPKLEKWYSRFNNFKEVNGELPTEELVNEIENYIQQSSPADSTDTNLKSEAEVESNVSVAGSPTEAQPPSSSPLPTFHLTQTDSEVSTKQDTFDIDLACILIERFLDMEASYTTTAKTIFCRVRKERKTVSYSPILHHLSQLRDDFLMYLRRPHTMQQFIEPFQLSFNEIENDMRRDVETKQELHQRTDDLRDKLWEISDLRKAEAEAERKTMNEDGWMEGRVGVLTNTYISLMQLEVDRYFESKRLLRDFFSGCRKMPLEDAVQPVLELPLVGASPPNNNPINNSTSSNINTLIPSSDDPSSTGKPPSRGGQRKKKEPPTPTRGNSMSALPVPNTSAAPTSPKATKPVPSSQTRKTKKKSIGEPIINRYDNEPFPDLYLAFCMAQNLVIDAEKRDEPVYGQASFEEIDVGQALQLEDKIFLSRLERIKDRGVRVLKDTKEQSEKLAAKEEEWLGKRFLTEMNAISALTRLVKDTIERERKLPYYFHLVDDEFIIEEDMLVFEPELAPPPPMPQELTYPDRFSSDQITALAQRFSLVAPWTLISVKDCSDLLFSLCATSANFNQELGFEFLPFEWQDLDLTQFTKLVKSFIRVEAGTPNYIPNSTTPSSSSNNSEFVDWREFLVFCVFSGSISPPSLLISSASGSNKNLNYTNNTTLVKSGSTSRVAPLNNLSLANNNNNNYNNYNNNNNNNTNNSINTDGSENNSVSTPTFVLPHISPLPISSKLSSTSPSPANSAPSSAHIKISSSPSTPSSAKTNDDQIPQDIPNENGIDNTETQEGAPQSNRLSYFGNFVSPSPPSMTQLAEMKAAFRGVDTDNDGKVTYAEYLKVPLWFESVTSEFSSPKQENNGNNSNSSDEVYSFFAQKLKRAIFQEINFNRGNRVVNDAPFSRNRSFYGTPKVDYMEFLSYVSVDWNEGEGIRKAIWISSDPPGRPLDLQKLVFLLHTQFAGSLLNEPARQLLYTISSDTQTAPNDPATLEILLSSPTGRALVERAYERFTLKNVKSYFRLQNASTS